MSDFKVGDEVLLKNFRQPMTIIEQINAITYKVAWFDKDDRLQVYEFLDEVLEKKPEPNKPTTGGQLTGGSGVGNY